MRPKSLAVAIGVALLLAAAATPAFAQSVDGSHFELGATVTLQGCVVAAERDGSYVFSHIVVWPPVVSVKWWKSVSASSPSA